MVAGAGIEPARCPDMNRTLCQLSYPAEKGGASYGRPRVPYYVVAKTTPVLAAVTPVRSHLLPVLKTSTTSPSTALGPIVIFFLAVALAEILAVTLADAEGAAIVPNILVVGATTVYWLLTIFVPTMNLNVSPFSSAGSVTAKPAAALRRKVFELSSAVRVRAAVSVTTMSFSRPAETLTAARTL